MIGEMKGLWDENMRVVGLWKKHTKEIFLVEF
jgi:hypothetical protein